MLNLKKPFHLIKAGLNHKKLQFFQRSEEIILLNCSISEKSVENGSRRYQKSKKRLNETENYYEKC